MSVTGIGVSTAAWDYWEYLRRLEAKQNTAVPSVMDAVKPVGEEEEKSASLTPENVAPVIPPERRNLFAQQLAASILERTRAEEQGEGEAAAAAKPSATAPLKKLSAALIQQAQIAYGMLASPLSF